MRRNKFMLRGKILPVIWSGILLGAVYLLIRFAALSFSDDVGQANGSIKDVIMTKLCVKVMESGSSFISFSANDEEAAFSFPVNLVANEFVLHNFIKDNSSQTAMAQEDTYTGYNDLTNVSDLADLAAAGKDDNIEDIPEEDDTSSDSKDIAGIYDISVAGLSKEYVMSNGAVFGYTDGSEGTLSDALNNQTPTPAQLQIGIEEGGIEPKDTTDNSADAVEAMENVASTKFTMEQLKDMTFLVRNFYIVDPATKVTESLFNAESMLDKDMTIKQTNEAPQILIYHTHSQETFIDSRPGVEEDTVVGIGTYLTQILEEEYGYNVIHDKSTYDIVNGVLDRNKAYNMAADGIEKILKDNPTIEVVIDLHRDGVLKKSDKRVITVNGKDTAQIMLYNGLCRDENGPLTRLDNPYLQDNLAFSLQLQLKSINIYPGLFYKNYLNAYRYNQHVRQKSILMELGTNYNTVQSEKNAMPLFAKVLDTVLKGE